MLAPKLSNHKLYNHLIVRQHGRLEGLFGEDGHQDVSYLIRLPGHRHHLLTGKKIRSA